MALAKKLDAEPWIIALADECEGKIAEIDELDGDDGCVHCDPDSQLTCWRCTKSHRMVVLIHYLTKAAGL